MKFLTSHELAVSTQAVRDNAWFHVVLAFRLQVRPLSRLSSPSTDEDFFVLQASGNHLPGRTNRVV